MIGVHDVGGKHGFGEIPKENSTFHNEWEKNVFAIGMLVRLHGVHNLHEKRHATERIGPYKYFKYPYYGRWLLATEKLLEENNILTNEEIEQRLTEIQNNERKLEKREDPELAQEARQLFESDRFSSEEGYSDDFKYDIGDQVIVKRNYDGGHIRVPQYAHDACGVVRGFEGVYNIPNKAIDGDLISEPVYSIEFTHQEIWGDEYPETDKLCISMWESYIKES